MAKLTVKTIESLVKAGTPGRTADGDGLYFQISKTGGTSWIYRFKIAGKSREMGLAHTRRSVHPKPAPWPPKRAS